MSMSKRKELYMGVLIGLYGNWLIQLIDKIQNQGFVVLTVFTLSFMPFILFFKEAFSKKPARPKGFSLKLMLGGVYIVMVYGAIALSELLFSNYYFTSVGGIFWILLLQVSVQAY
jgi:ABC-type multidrug transport system permease subunit